MKDYITWKQFSWTLGIMVTIIITAYGYLFNQTGKYVQQVQANTIMISRFDEKINNIMNTIVEIKDILKEK